MTVTINRSDDLCTALTTIAATALANKLGPIEELAANQRMVQIKIDSSHLAKSQVLYGWSLHLADLSMTIHTRPTVGPAWRLNVRGLIDGFPVVVHTTYYGAQARFIGSNTAMTPLELLVALVRGEQAKED